MQMQIKEKIELWLFIFVALGTTASLAASMTHMVEAFGWANLTWMGWVLAVVTVLQNGVFVGLATICRQGKVRAAVLAGMGLLFLVEFFGNYTAGGLLARRYLPEEITTLFFNVSRDVLIGTGTFLFAAFLPLLNFISIYALSEAGLRLLEHSSQTPPANEWANLVLQMQENGQGRSRQD